MVNHLRASTFKQQSLLSHSNYTCTIVAIDTMESPAKAIDGNERIANWLGAIDDEVSDTAVSDIEDGTQFNFQVQEDKYKEPITPERQHFFSQSRNEISPTDTLFSERSIFDKPYSRKHEPESPTPKRHFRDDESNLTSVDEDFDCLAVCAIGKQKHSAGQVNSGEEEEKQEETEEQNRHTAPSPIRIAESITSQSSPPAPEPSSSRRLVSLTSCLQCTLLSLPCTPTPPSCSRCIRNKQSHCLLYRRRFPCEVSMGISTYSPPSSLPTPSTPTSTPPSPPKPLNNLQYNPNPARPILLRLPTDTATTWSHKLSLEKKLLAEWQEVEDKKNWVCPRIESERRGGFKKGELVVSDLLGRRRGFPGGEERGVWVEMEVVTDDGIGKLK